MTPAAVVRRAWADEHAAVFWNGERLAAEYPDGIWLFELAAVTDPAAVPDAVAATLGIAQQSLSDTFDSLGLRFPQ